MKFTVHTMEYAGGRAETSLDLRNYQDSDYEEYRTMYNGCFLAMRTALELQPAECCAGREELARRRSEIWILEISGTLAGSVAIYGNEIDDLVVKGEFQGRGLGRAFYSGPWRFWNQRDAVPQSSTWQLEPPGHGDVQEAGISHHKDRSDRQNRLTAI